MSKAPLILTATKVKNQIQQDKESWLEKVFNESWERVYRTVQSLVGDRALAEDLALETFLRLHTHSHDFQEKSSLNGWLYRVSTNLALNALRSRKRRKHYQEKAGLLHIEEQGATDPAIEVELREERESVRDVLGEMKARQAELLILRHSGFSYAEIAAQIGVAPSSVGTMLVRAEQRFKELYEEKEGER